MKVIRVESCGGCPYIKPSNKGEWCCTESEWRAVSPFANPPFWCPLEDDDA